ncbi:MAG TPA: hypothetical protein PL033_21205 [Candidatus Brocadiia bacterium]|nr:hypothetical protein [Candidatus Brocadiia bacterium]
MKIMVTQCFPAPECQQLMPGYYVRHDFDDGEIERVVIWLVAGKRKVTFE